MLTLLNVEWRRYAALMTRYPLEPLTNILLLLLLFFTILLGLRPSSPTVVSGDYTAVNAVLGYVLWFFVILALSNFSTKLEEEAKLGTLEQVCLTSGSLFRVWMARSLVDFAFGLVQTAILVVLLLWMTDIRVTVPVLALLPACLTVLAVYGFGLMLGGVSLVFRRTGELKALCQMFFLALAIVPLTALPGWLHRIALVLPLSLGLDTVRGVVGHREVAWTVLAARLPSLIVLACAYCALGYATFAFAYRMARVRGLLARY